MKMAVGALACIGKDQTSLRFDLFVDEGGGGVSMLGKVRNQEGCM